MPSNRPIILKAHRKRCALLAHSLTAAQPDCWQCHCRRWNTKPFLETSSGKLLVSQVNWAVFCGAVCWSQSFTPLLSQLVGARVSSQGNIKTSQSLIGCFHFHHQTPEDLDWSKLHVVFLVCFTFGALFFFCLCIFLLNYLLFVLLNSWEVVCAAAGWHLSRYFNMDECLL